MSIVRSAKRKLPLTHIALACHLLAGLLFWSHPGLHLSQVWVVQFYLLLGTSAILSLSLICLPVWTTKNGGLLLIQLVIIVIISIPQGDFLLIEMTLASGLLLQAACYLEHPYDKLYSGVIILLVLFLHPTSIAWGTTLLKPDVADRALASFHLLILVVLGQLLRSWEKRNAVQTQQIGRLEEATHRLISANMGFQQYADHIEEKSTEDERKRITQEIHDTVAYTLVNIMMMLREISSMCGDNPDLRELHEKLLLQAQTGLNETRRALRILRASTSTEVSPSHEIHRLATAFSKATGVKVCVEYGNMQEVLAHDMYTCVFHMIQEGMANALRHGHATRIDIHLWQSDSELLLYLTDNGSGCEAMIEEGIGLAGMRERVQSLGGSFSAGNVPDGFRISARLPCPGGSDE